MSDFERYSLVLENLIQGLIPNATPHALGKIDDVMHDLALDGEAFGKWFDIHIRKYNLSLQEIDLVGLLFYFIAYDLTTYIKNSIKKQLLNYKSIVMMKTLNLLIGKNYFVG